mmetsp:Transcript_11758/g.21744  ORF Transcript_11758/g.21744 Transcript_11758/m.21744 type:complete len:171 (-) Transcript_11758:196-708(-)
MGNRSSSTSSASTEGQEGGGSGLYLSPELQAKINTDFDSHILQTEWNKYRTLHLQRHQHREVSSSLRQHDIQQQMEALQSQAKLVHDKLDEMVDASTSKLVDLEMEVGHDVNRLGKKFEGSLSAGATPERKCLDVRAELSHCYTTLKDTGECQIFAQKLDKCVTEALASS